MKLYTNSKLFKILPKNVEAITLWPFGIFFADTIPFSRTVSHEEIHWAQQRETFGLFYPWYLVEWILHGFNYRKISFEREAYENEYNLLYRRGKWEFLKYL